MSNEVIIDGYNTLEERKLLIHTDEYSIGEDGLIDSEIPFTDICYDLALRLQRMKAENEELKQYKQSKQASYEAMQKEWNNAINENRLLIAALENKNFVAIAEENERLKAENEQLKNDIETGVMCVSCTKELLNCNLHKENEKLKSKIPWFEKWCLSNNECIKYKQALEEIRELSKKGHTAGNDCYYNKIVEIVNEVLKNEI